MTALVVCGLAVAGGASVVWLMREIATRGGYLDHPNERSSHTVPTPRLGGVGIWAPVVVLSALFLTETNEWVGRIALLWPILVGALAIAGVGLVDDLRSGGIRPTTKYLGQAAAAAVAVFAAGAFLGTGDQASDHSLPLLILAGLVQILWLTAIANFTNFMDGADGLVGGIAVIALTWCSLILASEDDSLRALALLAASATLGFLVFNLPRATIFMGDSGSLFVGFTLAAIGLALPATYSDGMTIQTASDYARGAGAALMITAPIWVDAVTTLGIRAACRRPVTTAHRDHLYQRMLGAGAGPWSVDIAYWAYAVLCGAAAYATSEGITLGYVAAALLVAAGVLAVVGLHRTGVARSWG